MFGKILGAVVGAKAAKSHRGGLDGPGGALLGMGAMALVRRFGPIGFIAATAGGYAIKRYNDRRKSATPADAAPSADAAGVNRHRL